MFIHIRAWTHTRNSELWQWTSAKRGSYLPKASGLNGATGNLLSWSSDAGCGPVIDSWFSSLTNQQVKLSHNVIVPDQNDDKTQSKSLKFEPIIPKCFSQQSPKFVWVIMGKISLWQLWAFPHMQRCLPNVYSKFVYFYLLRHMDLSSYHLQAPLMRLWHVAPYKFLLYCIVLTCSSKRLQHRGLHQQMPFTEAPTLVKVER